MQPTPVSDLIRRMTGLSGGNNELLHTSKLNRVAGAAPSGAAIGQAISYFQFDGTPGAGSAPGTTPRNPDNTTGGGILQADPGGGKTRWLTYVGGYVAPANTQGHLTIHDRLADVSGLDASSSSLQTISGSGLTLSRYTDGVAVELAVEIWTLIGTTARTLTVNYTNTANASKTTTVTIGGTNLREAQRWINVPLADGDLGIKSVQSVQLNNTTGTAGNFGLVLFRRLVEVPISSVDSYHDASLLSGLMEVKTDACISMFYLSGSTATGALFTTFQLVDA